MAKLERTIANRSLPGGSGVSDNRSDAMSMIG